MLQKSLELINYMMEVPCNRRFWAQYSFQLLVGRDEYIMMVLWCLIIIIIWEKWSRNIKSWRIDWNVLKMKKGEHKRISKQQRRKLLTCCRQGLGIIRISWRRLSITKRRIIWLSSKEWRINLIRNKENKGSSSIESSGWRTIGIRRREWIRKQAYWNLPK